METLLKLLELLPSWFPLVEKLRKRLQARTVTALVQTQVTTVETLTIKRERTVTTTKEAKRKP
jgi:hypothetical protein